VLSALIFGNRSNFGGRRLLSDRRLSGRLTFGDRRLLGDRLPLLSGERHSFCERFQYGKSFGERLAWRASCMSGKLSPQ